MLQHILLFHTFLLLNNIHSSGALHLTSSLWLDGHMVFFQLLIIMNIVLLNICMQVFALTYGFIPLYMYRCIAGLYGKSMSYILRNWQTLFQSNCMILHSNQQCKRILISLHPCQHLQLSLFYYSHHNKNDVVSQYGLVCILP